MAVSYFIQLLALVALPAFFVVLLWRSNEPDIARWLIKVAYTGAFLAYLLLLGRWDLLTVYLRYALVVAYLVAVIASARRLRGLKWVARNEPGATWAFAVPLAVLVLFAAFTATAVRGFLYSAKAIALDFPLRNGWFYVGQGGSSTLLNQHRHIEAQQYALDIVALNSFGARARGAMPVDRSKYVIYEKPVYAPCSGRVLVAQDGAPDHVPPASDRKNVAGNHVVIGCEGARVLVAHLREGSVQVSAGDSVDSQSVLGAVGNSGNTSEPHLHIHAVAEGSGDVLKGVGVPMLFKGRFLVRNITWRAGPSNGWTPVVRGLSAGVE